MIPINVTHTAIVTRSVLTQLLAPGSAPTPIGKPLPKATSRLRYMLSTLIGFFAESYKSTFGFVDGPPLHDALTIAYVEKPELFTCKRHRVDVELAGTHTAGETVVDVFNYRSVDDSWGRDGKNCLVAERVDVRYPIVAFSPRLSVLIPYLQVDGFFELFLDCIARCDKVSPLNHQ